MAADDREKKSPGVASNGGFEKRRCAECGCTLEAQKTSYVPARRLYCESCKTIGHVKDNWQPMIGASVTGMFVLDSTGKIVPFKRS